MQECGKNKEGHQQRCTSIHGGETSFRKVILIIFFLERLLINYIIFQRLISGYENKVQHLKIRGKTRRKKRRRKKARSLHKFRRFVLREVLRASNRNPFRQCSVNIHWRPFYCSCAPCNIDYEVLAKIETLKV